MKFELDVTLNKVGVVVMVGLFCFGFGYAVRAAAEPAQELPEMNFELTEADLNTMNNMMGFYAVIEGECERRGSAPETLWQQTEDGQQFGMPVCVEIQGANQSG